VFCENRRSSDISRINFSNGRIHKALKYGPIINENKTKYLKCTRKQTQDGKLNVELMQFEQVDSFKYLGSIVNKNNTIEEEIKQRIMAGNKAFYTNKRMFQEIQVKIILVCNQTSSHLCL
jgi:hypothetical protein